MNRSLGLSRLVALLTSAVTSTVPAIPEGAISVQLVVLTQLTALALRVANLKDVPVVPTLKPLPVTVTLVPPAVEPLLGSRAVIVGMYLKWSLLVSELPPAVFVTVTSTVPALAGGAITVIEVAELTVNSLAGVAPNETPETAVNSVPVIVTGLPPAAGPLLSESLLTLGAFW